MDALSNKYHVFIYRTEKNSKVKSSGFRVDAPKIRICKLDNYSFKLKFTNYVYVNLFQLELPIILGFFYS